MSQHDYAEGTQSVGSYRNGHGYDDVYRAPQEAPVHQHGKEASENNGGYQKTKAGAGLGDLKRALGYFDHVTIRVDRYLEGMQSCDCDTCSNPLQCGDEESTARH